MQQLNHKNFRQALIVTIIAAITLFASSFFYGKNELFLLLNTNLGTPADLFFQFCTFMGDGVWWLAVLLLFVVFRKKYLPLLISSFAVSELIIQLFKSILFPNTPRPTKAIIDLTQIHTVKGVELHTIGSFPSGHTTAAFCFFLLATLVINKKWIVPVGFIYAISVAYSRVYLAQHFPVDLAGGMIAASISVSSGLLITRKWLNRNIN